MTLSPHKKVWGWRHQRRHKGLGLHFPTDFGAILRISHPSVLIGEEARKAQKDPMRRRRKGVQPDKPKYGGTQKAVGWNDGISELKSIQQEGRVKRYVM